MSSQGLGPSSRPPKNSAFRHASGLSPKTTGRRRGWNLETSQALRIPALPLSLTLTMPVWVWQCPRQNKKKRRGGLFAICLVAPPPHLSPLASHPLAARLPVPLGFWGATTTVPNPLGQTGLKAA